jgi:transposase InsO family protein
MVKKRKNSKKNGSFTPEFRLEVVKLHLEDGYTIVMLANEFGCGQSTISNWIKKYNDHGEAGLSQGGTRRKQKRKPQNKALQSQIIELKKADPQRGVKRISDIMRRFFMLKASPETVRQTLHEAKLIEPPPKKRRKNIQKPRRFERATPNQMWQTDICCFRLAGQNAYLLGFIDDYSRYIVGMGLYRSQTAQNLLEVMRLSIGEYGVPKEMLTDNGRQYTNWRGTTKFEKELKKDRIKHIKSRPQHPMTLGKIERFWKTILNEFLFRSQFDSFENARDRLALWIKYYNYKRPHQGIGGLCPADRFFEVQGELRQTLEKGIEENTLELALRGKPQRPFYMVGRLGDQNVAIRAEKGKIKMHVDDPERLEGKELVYDINMEDSNGGEEVTADAGQRIAGETFNKTTQYTCSGEVSGCTISLDGKLFDQRSLPGFVSDPCSGKALAGDRDGGNAFIAGSSGAESETDSAIQPTGETSEKPKTETKGIMSNEEAHPQKEIEDRGNAALNTSIQSGNRRVHSHSGRRRIRRIP